MTDIDEEIDRAEIAEEEAMELMKTAKIQYQIKTHRIMKWRLAMRIASQPDERWVVKAAGWNPELSTKYKNQQSCVKTKKKMRRRD